MSFLSVLLLATPVAADPILPNMVPIPAGTFQMGEREGLKASKPVVTVTVPKPFSISATEITWTQYEACIAAGACAEPRGDHGWGKGDRPVINITYWDAEAYAAWLTVVTGTAYRLPSEAEWEYAARAGSATRFPWGDVVEGRANCRKCDGEEVRHETLPVMSYPANKWGLFDTSGNVWEWTADCWTKTHDGRIDQISPREEGACSHRAIRGGSWYFMSKMSWSAARSRQKADQPSYNIGFRVVSD